MDKYLVIHDFKDSEDNYKVYLTCRKDMYPRDGLKPSSKRIEELLTSKNKIGKAVIKKVEIIQKDEKRIEV